MNTKRHLGRSPRPSEWITDAALTLLGLAFIFPFVWMILLSFKADTEMYTNPFGLPAQWLYGNYIKAYEAFDVLRSFLNSVIYTGATILVTIAVGSLFAYSIARMKWRFKNAALTYISMGMFIPVQVVIVPLFILVRDLGLRNSYPGLILPYSAFNLPVCVLMLYAFFRSLPYQLEEAAVLDGCGVMRCFLRIIMPMVKPAIAVQVILLFNNIWNEFVTAYLLVTDPSMATLPIGLLNFFVGAGVNQWGQIGAAMVMTTMPAVIVYIRFHEQIEHALSASAMLK